MSPRSKARTCPRTPKNGNTGPRRFGSISIPQRKDTLPRFSYDRFVQRSSTIDVIWFNERGMPHTFFEVEHSTDIQNSLLKYHELQDFNARMMIVSSGARRQEYEAKRDYPAFQEIKGRLRFLDYDALARDYERALEESQRETVL